MTPDQPQAFDFWLSPRVATIQANHALRLVLSTQALQADCAGRTIGVDPCNPTTPQIQSLPGRYKVTFSSAMPSLINLPLLPLNHFKARGNEATPRIWSEGAN